MIENTCYAEGCMNFDKLTLVDFTCGPLGDYRYYCPIHVDEAKKKRSIEAQDRNIEYLKGVVRQKEREVFESQERLRKALEER